MSPAEQPQRAPEELLSVASVARRIGVAPATLRTWARRYGIGPSSHEAGSHRKYCPSDLAKLTVMRRLISAGVAPADAAEQAKAHEGEVVIDENSYTAKIKGRSLDLTFKEFELIKFLAQHPGRVFTRAQLLQEIWGYDYFGGTRTVDVHIRRLRSKLGPEHEAIVGTVRNVGYRFTLPSAGKEAPVNERI